MRSVIGRILGERNVICNYSREMPVFDPNEYRRDIVVFNLPKRDCVLLVFPTGARINDPSGLLSGSFTDGRRVAQFTSLAQVQERAADLRAALHAWLRTVAASA
ncbi:DUF1801 domain-containing protein [Hymenobacter sp. BT175]|nr:DUF1801 domain-containing protein [Hymenobacter translucens]MCC2546506.1 DUF1801 domain-containing protein [Hymenobacter translucens]